MKNNVFNSWFKELCSLIFVQSFQAFLLAIIMSVIVKILASTNAASLDGGIDAAGLLAIFALASFSKIELLIKSIFGLTSEHGDPSLAGGKTSLAGTWLALKGVGRVLNNGGKIVTGAGKAIGGQLRLRRALNERDRNEIANRVSDSPEISSEADLPSEKNINSLPKKSIESSIADDNKIVSKEDMITNLSNEINALTHAINEQNMNQKSKAAREADKDHKDKMKSLENAIENARKERNEGLKSMFSGSLETVGALHGAVAGAVYGLSKGDDIASSAAAAAGAGDIIGEKVAAAINSTPSSLKNLSVGIKSEIEAHVPGNPYKKIEKELKEERKKELEKLNEKLELYSKQKGVSKKSKNSVDNID